MKRIAWVAVSWLLLGISPIILASEQPSCAGKALSEVRTLTALPNEVNSLLGQNRAGLDGIADRGGKFNVTDVVDEPLPMRRFAIAGINPSCVMVALELGGRGYSVELIVFEYANGKWEATHHINIPHIPKSLQELVAYAEVATFNPWIISKIEYFKEKSQIPGEDADRTAVLFKNGKRLIIPLVNAKAIAVLKGADETYFLFASGTDCWHCDENIGLRFYKLGGLPLTEAKRRYSYPGRLYDYMDSKSLQQETRAFFGNCLNESNEVVIWFLKYLGDDSKWHTSTEVARLSKSGDELVDLNPKDGSLESVLSAVKRGICKELPGVDGTTEP